jgi:hypothetical protein
LGTEVPALNTALKTFTLRLARDIDLLALLKSLNSQLGAYLKGLIGPIETELPKTTTGFDSRASKMTRFWLADF